MYMYMFMYMYNYMGYSITEVCLLKYMCMYIIYLYIIYLYILYKCMIEYLFLLL